MKVISYNQTFNEITVMNNKCIYTYANVSPFLYSKIVGRIKHNPGQVWQILRRLSLVEKTCIVPQEERN